MSDMGDMSDMNVLGHLGGLAILISALACLTAAIGILRLETFFARFHAAGIAPTIGVGAAMIAVALHFADFRTTCASLIILLVGFLTSPVAGHYLALIVYLHGHDGLAKVGRFKAPRRRATGNRRKSSGDRTAKKS